MVTATPTSPCCSGGGHLRRLRFSPVHPVHVLPALYSHSQPITRSVLPLLGHLPPSWRGEGLSGPRWLTCGRCFTFSVCRSSITRERPRHPTMGCLPWKVLLSDAPDVSPGLRRSLLRQHSVAGGVLKPMENEKIDTYPTKGHRNRHLSTIRTGDHQAVGGAADPPGFGPSRVRRREGPPVRPTENEGFK